MHNGMEFVTSEVTSIEPIASYEGNGVAKNSTGNLKKVQNYCSEVGVCPTV